MQWKIVQVSRASNQASPGPVRTGPGWSGLGQARSWVALASGLDWGCPNSSGLSDVAANAPP